MDTSFAKRFGGVELDDALPVLLRDERALGSLQKHLGQELAAELARFPIDNIPHGDLRDQIHDFFLDELLNESKPVWSGVLVDPDDEDNPDRRFPIFIYEYGGIYYVWALEDDPMGYFLARSDAEKFIHFNWDNVRPS